MYEMQFTKILGKPLFLGIDSILDQATKDYCAQLQDPDELVASQRPDAETILDLYATNLDNLP